MQESQNLVQSLDLTIALIVTLPLTVVVANTYGSNPII